MPEKKQANNKNKKKINILTYCHLKVNKFVNRPEKLFLWCQSSSWVVIYTTGKVPFFLAQTACHTVLNSKVECRFCCVLCRFYCISICAEKAQPGIWLWIKIDFIVCGWRNNWLQRWLFGGKNTSNKWFVCKTLIKREWKVRKIVYS